MNNAAIKYLENAIQGMKADFIVMDDFPSDICKKPCPVAPTWPGETKPKEGSKPMASYAQANVVTADTIERDQRQAVASAIYSAFNKLKVDLKKQFGLIDDEAPKTPAELVKRIADGQYTIDKEHTDYESWDASGAIRYVRWRNPETVEDKAGYKAARAKLDETYEEFKLKALLTPVADLLQLVEDFKAFKA